MFEEAISLLSIWASMNSWLTPTVLFLLLNLMIGTIAVTSGFTSYKPSHHHHLNHPDSSFHHYHQPPQHQLQPQLTRAPSVLQRLKSINLYTFYSHPPTNHLQQPPPPQQQPEPHQPNSPTTTTAAVASNEDYENPTLDEIYSRIKQDNSISHYGRQYSDTKPSGGEIPVKLSKKMKKSASDKSAFNHFDLDEETENVGVGGHTAVPTVEEEDIEEERENAVFVQQEREDQDDGVDAKADDFINMFKKQLQMQRTDSIVRYKEMVSRTSAQ